MSMSSTSGIWSGRPAGLDEELTAGLHSGAVAEDVQRHVDGHGLVSRDSQEVSMDGIVSYRVELKLVKDSQIVLAIDVEVHDVAVGSVGESLEVSCIYREENVLDSVAVEIAGYLTLSADALGERLTALSSCGAV